MTMGPNHLDRRWWWWCYPSWSTSWSATASPLNSIWLGTEAHIRHPASWLCARKSSLGVQLGRRVSGAGLLDALKFRQMDQLTHLTLWEEGTGESILMHTAEMSYLSHLSRLERMVCPHSFLTQLPWKLSHCVLRSTILAMLTRLNNSWVSLKSRYSNLINDWALPVLLRIMDWRL